MGSGRGVRDLAEIIGVALAYVLAANVGRLVASYGIVTAVWPPSGVALAALLLGGVRLWPGVALGVLVTIGVDAQPAPPPLRLPAGAIVAMMIGNTAEPLIGAVLLRRFGGFTGRFDTVREVVALLVFAAGLAATVSATVGTAALYVSGMLAAEQVPDTCWTWWVGNVLGIVVLTPFLVAWRTGPPLRLQPPRTLEAMALIAGATVCAAHAIFGMFPAVPRATREAYLLFPFLVWAALRFGPRGAAASVFGVSCVALASTAMRLGHFANPDLPATILRVQVFVGVVSATILLLAASVAERRRSFDEVRALKDHLEELVRQRTEELQDSNRDLESFAFKASHDLRAPVRAIRGFTELLQEDYGPAMPPEARVLLQRVASAAGRMSVLIEALLDVSRLGKGRLQLQEVDVGELVAGVVGELSTGPPGPDVEVIVGELLPCRADPALLRQVFANLLENAVKYTRTRTSPRVEVGMVAVDGAPAWFVRDNGVGFDMQYADQLFRVFSRLPGDQFDGTGLGLAIVQRIVDQHGGRVWAESEPDRGATFWFTLGPQSPDPSAPTGSGQK